MTDDLLFRIAELERRDAELLQYQMAIARAGCEERARFRTMYSIALELAMHQGMPREVFDEQLTKRFNFFLENELFRIEDTNPSFATLMDSRPENAELSEGFSPMFPKSHQPGRDIQSRLNALEADRP